MLVAAFIASPNLPWATRRSRLAVLITAEGTGTEISERAPPPDPTDALPTDPAALDSGANGAALAPRTLGLAAARRGCFAAVAPAPSPPDDPAPPAHPAAAPARPESTTVAATATVARRIPVIAHPFAVDVTQTGKASPWFPPWRNVHPAVP